MSRDNHQVRDYIDSHFAPEDALLAKVRAAGESLQAGMQISAGEGKLLSLFATITGAKRILEIGCFMGYSAICMARALPKDGALITIESRDEYAELAEQHIAQSNLPITVIRGRALEQIASLEGLFDMIFIDADKISYAQYLQAALPLLREGGLMIGDNTLLFGAVYGQPTHRTSPSALKAMTQFNQRMNDGNPLEGVMIPTDEGLTVAIKRPAGTKSPAIALSVEKTMT